MNSTLAYTLITATAIVTIGTAMWGIPQYSVYSANLSGKAELVKAEQNRQIRVQEAKALKESAGFQAEAEVIRAKGVAKANSIIGEGLKDNEAYIKYLWIVSLTEKENITTIYVPTGNNGLPLIKDVK